MNKMKSNISVWSIFIVGFFLQSKLYAQDLVSIIGVGDIMMGTNFPSQKYLPLYGGDSLLIDVYEFLNDADVTFGNLEGTLLDSGGTAKRCNDPSVCYAFRSPESYVKHLTKAGIDVVSIANNHIGDFGPTGRKRTKEVLNSDNIYFAGLEGTDEHIIWEKDSIIYGMAAFAPNSGTCDIRNIPRAISIVKQLESKCDIVIVSFHGGAEGVKNQHVPRKMERYYGENRGDVYKFSHAVIDAGADLVLGHGPHVTRALELYKDRLICYSLGNFCTYGRFNLREEAGLAPILKTYLTPSGEFVYAKIRSIYQTKTTGPKPDKNHRAFHIIRQLTEVDFPATNLLFYDDGVITRKD